MNSAIEKIHEFERFGSVLGLERMTVLLEKLGNPEKNLKVIHVAGTNGKGSICKYIYEVLQAGGYKTGLYTSPFLEVFNERIQFNGKYISDKELNLYTEKVLEKSKEMVEEGLESPTEFEVVTALAFLYFKEKKSDYVVLEVGLGGRGDSTNVVKQPLVSIIASISLDHTDRLGNTIPEIAFEKAGIIKKECPVVIGTDRDDAKEVFFDRSKELNAPIYDVSKIEREIISESIDGYKFRTEILGSTNEIEISMVGKHQVDNAMVALFAIRLLIENNDLSLAESAILSGFKRAKQIGRFEVIRKEPYVIIDGAHNPDGTLALRNTVEKHFKDKKILLVTGILADKDIDSILDNFIGITDTFVVTEPENPRKMDAEELAEKITTKGGKCIIIKLPKDAVDFVNQYGHKYDVVIFAGSLYLIGKVRGLLNHDKKAKEDNIIL